LAGVDVAALLVGDDKDGGVSGSMDVVLIAGLQAEGLRNHFLNIQ